MPSLNLWGIYNPTVFSTRPVSAKNSISIGKRFSLSMVSAYTHCKHGSLRRAPFAGSFAIYAKAKT